jgi:hypothetical protein
MPFEGTFPDGIDPESIDSYALAHGVAITPFSGLELSGAIQLQFDEQSNPFLIGVLFNSGPSELSPHLLFPIEIEGRLVRVFELESAIPLSPGELRPFGLRLRDLPLEPGEQDVDIDPIVEAQAHDSRGKLTLALDIDTLETTGSSVFFKGSVANDSGQLAQAPSVFAAMRNLEGELLTAAWLALTHPLASGEDEQFVLEVPLPAGAEIAEGEWDLIALGMPGMAGR